MLVPRTLEELDHLVSSQVQESLHLDYKRSEALNSAPMDKAKSELAKDVSAFANSDGGVLIFGIEEVDHLPLRIDDGVEDSKWSREKLENVIMSGVRPRLEVVEIIQISRKQGTSLYVVAVQKSLRGAHQETNGLRYYKRFNFQSVPMEDYEIRDLRARAASLPPLVSLDAEIRDSYFVDLVVTNNGDAVAEGVSFRFAPDAPEVTTRSSPNFFTKGIPYLPPRKEFRMFYGSALGLLNGELGASPSVFDVEMSYTDPRVGRQVLDTVHIDITTFVNAPIVHSPARQLGDTLKEAIDKLTREVSGLKTVLESFQPVVGGTGLDLSVTTLRNLRHALHGEADFEKVDAAMCAPEAFRELLGISMPLAHAISNFLRYRRYYPTSKFEDIQGLTPEVIAAFHRFFRYEEGPRPASPA